MTLEQGDPADGRQWTLHEDIDKQGLPYSYWHGPIVNGAVVVVPLERAQRAEAEAKRLRKHFEGLNVARRGPMGALLEHYEERAERAEAAARTFARSLAEIALDRSHEGGASDAFLAMNALELHPGFLPNDPEAKR